MVILALPREGFEPTLPSGKRILSPPRLPFRHLGTPGARRQLGQVERGRGRKRGERRRADSNR